jgi:tetratricopeptide (TPR) repeat protein
MLEINMTRKSILGFSIALAILLPTVASAQQLDSIVGARGTPTFGTVAEMSREQVTMDTRQGKKQFAVNEIQKLSFGDEPVELRRARESILRGQLESARADLDRIVVSEVRRKEAIQDIEFYKGFCDGRLALAGGGDKATAVRELRTFLEKPENKDSYHYYDVVELLGDLAIGLSSYENAVKYYDMLAAAPWPDYQMKAAVLAARAMVANQQYDEAAQKYETVLGMGIDDARARELKQFATVGKAVCLAETGKADEGVALVTSIISENDSQANPELFGRAYNALGTCHLKADRPQDALLAFLHVDLLFYQDAEVHAEALYYLSELWRTVNKSDRAIRTRSLLKSRYSGSPWANRK